MFEVQAKAMKNRHIIAVDGGGTRSRVALAGCDGTVLSQIEGGFANLTSDFETSRINIETAIGDAYEAAQVPADSLQRDVAVLGIAVSFVKYQLSLVVSLVLLQFYHNLSIRILNINNFIYLAKTSSTNISIYPVPALYKLST